jgi:MHS family proline/betaine transporter-like MFS transporter
MRSGDRKRSLALSEKDPDRELTETAAAGVNGTNGDISVSRSLKQHGNGTENRSSPLSHSDGKPSNLRNIGVPRPEKDGIMTTAPSHTNHSDSGESDFWQTVAGVAGNVLEWYDFAVFGYFGDIIGEVFFAPGPDGEVASVEDSFLVFGGAFLMRPIGGMLLGYVGDVYGRKKALVISVFLMAFPTFFMGCLPGYRQIGDWAIVLLVLIRLLQGLSVGGQLMSSLVFTLESHDPAKWGLYGSFVMAAANFGTLLGGVVGFAVRSSLSHDQLVSWGWRIPFLLGILVSISGFYLRSHGGDHDGHHYIPTTTNAEVAESEANGETLSDCLPSADQSQENDSRNLDVADDDTIFQQHSDNPFLRAIARDNIRSLLAASMVPMLWSAGFYLTFVWMAIFMSDLIEEPVPGAFGVNSGALLFSVCLLFPMAGILSDRYGRRPVMALGGVGMGVGSPILVILIGRGNALLAFFAQSIMGIMLSFWGAPMCAWLVESFEPDARLTSVAIGYNLAQALAGGSTPYFATVLVDKLGPGSPGVILTALAVIALTGLLCVAPPPPEEQSVPAKRRGPRNTFSAVPTNLSEAEEAGCEMVETPTNHTDPDDSYEHDLI